MATQIMGVDVNKIYVTQDYPIGKVYEEDGIKYQFVKYNATVVVYKGDALTITTAGVATPTTTGAVDGIAYKTANTNGASTSAVYGWVVVFDAMGVTPVNINVTTTATADYTDPLIANAATTKGKLKAGTLPTTVLTATADVATRNAIINGRDNSTVKKVKDTGAINITTINEPGTSNLVTTTFSATATAEGSRYQVYPTADIKKCEAGDILTIGGYSVVITATGADYVVTNSAIPTANFSATATGQTGSIGKYQAKCIIK
jgi:hypothetical protein